MKPLDDSLLFAGITKQSNVVVLVYRVAIRMEQFKENTRPMEGKTLVVTADCVPIKYNHRSINPSSYESVVQ